MTNKDYNANADLYQRQIRQTINRIVEGAGPEYADAVFKMVLGYAKGAGIWYVQQDTAYDIPGDEELQGIADALCVHAKPLKQFIESQGGLTTDVCDWSQFEDGVSLLDIVNG